MDNVEIGGHSSLHSSYIVYTNSGLRALEGLLNWSMTLVFIFLCATNQAKALTLDETFDFQINLVGWKGRQSEEERFYWE